MGPGGMESKSKACGDPQGVGNRETGRRALQHHCGCS